MSVLAIDLGASGGRVMRADLHHGRMSVSELHRFGNTPVKTDGQLRWNVAGLFREIKRGLAIAAEQGDFDSVGIDAWGVDYALVDARGQAAPAVCYRDERTRGTRERVLSQIPEGELYRRTGLQVNEIHTLFQLAAQPPGAGQSMLLMPDLFGWLLTGQKTCELSIASTTQLLDPVTRDWDHALIREMGFPEECFLPIARAGKRLGNILPEHGLPQKPVITVPGHDTACAVFSVPAEEESFLYISCGTWSIVGTELDAAVCTERARLSGLQNEAGYAGKAQLLRNITGLWLIQELRRCLGERDGREYSYAEMEAMAAGSAPLAHQIDPDDALFAMPGDMPARIQKYTGQAMTDAQLLRCVYDSLALKYRWAAERLEAVTGRRFEKIYMVGGGIQSALLCGLTANALGRPVLAGPVEATAIGNAAAQMIALGQIADAAEARQIIRESFAVKEYRP
ncbi:MAG: rhamnulokinase [Oscillospiraceae bacterium]|nr:rhamnulokinase [Oscillospiraceae bacterium]